MSDGDDHRTAFAGPLGGRSVDRLDLSPRLRLAFRAVAHVRERDHVSVLPVVSHKLPRPRTEPTLRPAQHYDHGELPLACFGFTSAPRTILTAVFGTDKDGVVGGIQRPAVH